MKTQNLKTNVANIAIRIVRAFNVPINLQAVQPRNEERGGFEEDRMHKVCLGKVV